MSYSKLKDKHRSVRDDQEKSLSIRIHRSLSWLGKAEQETDEDAQFIFLWISFNAAYACSCFDHICVRIILKKFNETSFPFIKHLNDSD